MGKPNISAPIAYHITFNCYGKHLHGDEDGSIDPKHNIPGTELISESKGLHKYESDLMDQPPYELDGPKRIVVLKAIMEVCKFRGWELLAAHVRTNHVHTVVESPEKPEKIMHEFKAYSTRHLNLAGYDYKGRKHWARHGSTQYKWTVDEVQAAVDYVVRRQGDPPMEVYERS